MATTSKRPALVAIVGPTASGKSDLAMKVAKKFNGEIICADSRTIYKGMDIGTAKPSRKEQTAVPHWGLDLVEPGQRFSAAQFKKYAEEILKDIQNRGKLPILVGGTGLYIDSIIFDFSFIPRPGLGKGKGKELEKMNIGQLQDMIRKLGYPMPKNFQNRRHLINTIERKGKTGSKRGHLPENILLIGLLPSDGVIKQRISKRAEEIFSSGVLDETKKLVGKYGEEKLLKTAGIVYRLCLAVLKDEMSESSAIEKFKILDWQYARRQKTWFKRNRAIKWFSNSDLAFEAVKRALLNT